MAFTKKAFRWLKRGTVPPESKQENGFEDNDILPHEYFNEMLSANFEAIEELQEKAVEKVEGKGLSTNDYTDKEKEKIESTETGANKYVAPIATASTHGDVKVGMNISVVEGNISVLNASTTAKGVVQLTDSVTSTSTTTAATANAVKNVNDKIMLSNPFVICDTASNDANKIASLSNFVLTVGQAVRVKFTQDNTASAPTLNINGTGAKKLVKQDGSDHDKIVAGGVYSFTYDGANFMTVSGEDGETDIKKHGIVEDMQWRPYSMYNRIGTGSGVTEEHLAVSDSNQIYILTKSKVFKCFSLQNGAVTTLASPVLSANINIIICSLLYANEKIYLFVTSSTGMYLMRYDVTSGTWTTLTSPPLTYSNTARASLLSTGDGDNDEFYVFYSSALLVYKVSTDTWTTKTTAIPTQDSANSYGYRTGAQSNGKFYLLSLASSSIMTYNITSNTFSSLGGSSTDLSVSNSPTLGCRPSKNKVCLFPQGRLIEVDSITDNFAIKDRMFIAGSPGSCATINDKTIFSVYSPTQTVQADAKIMYYEGD